MSERIVRRFLADLHPPLGKPGGPCKVVQRIDDEVRNPNLKRQLIQDVMHGESLTNPEASQVYDSDREMTGNKLIKRIEIGPHGQYRMDLRGVTIEDIKDALNEYTARLPKSAQIEQERETEIVSKSGLLVVFVLRGNIAKIITTYWRGVPDPKVPTSGCSV